MRFTSAVLVLATVLSTASAGPVGHAHHLKHKRALVVEKRVATDLVTATATRTATVFVSGQATGAPLPANMKIPAGEAANENAAAQPTPAASSPAVASPAAPAASPSAAPVSDNDWTTPLSQSALARLSDLKLKLGTNSYTLSETGVSLQDVGSAGYTNTFTNSYSEEIIVFIWSKGQMFPLVAGTDATFSLAPGQSRTVTYGAKYASAGYAALYPDSALGGLPAISLENGLIFQTWGEFTMSGVNTPHGYDTTFQISREVNAKGREMSIQGPTCLSDFTHCYFACIDKSVPYCGKDNEYDLFNCAGQNVGTWGGQPAGGCKLNAPTGNMVTTFF